MENETYKVELTEKEARMVGETRWGNKHRRRYLWGGTAALLGAFAFFVGTVFAEAPDWVVVGGSLLLVALSFFLPLRMLWLQEKAGKAFVQSLKEKK
jgi:hypothetical protein